MQNPPVHVGVVITSNGGRCRAILMECAMFSLVVAALATMLRWQPGCNLGDNDDTTRHFSGRSVRVLALGWAFVGFASRIPTRERGAGSENPVLDQRTCAVLVSVLVSCSGIRHLEHEGKRLKSDRTPMKSTVYAPGKRWGKTA